MLTLCPNYSGDLEEASLRAAGIDPAYIEAQEGPALEAAEDAGPDKTETN